MAFEEYRHKNGDDAFDIPAWRRMVEEELKRNKKSLFEKTMEDFSIREKEVAIKHPETGASIRLTDDGAIELMVENGNGIRITEEGVSFFGKKLAISTGLYELHTKQNGVWINNTNEKGIQDFDRKKGVGKKLLDEMKENGMKGRGLRDED